MSLEFSKLDIQEKKKIHSKAWLILAVIGVCFLASLVVRGVVSERINNISQAQNSVEISLPKLGFGAPQIFNQIAKKNVDPTEYEYEANDIQPANVEIKVTLDPETKEVGKKEIMAFTARNTISGKIDTKSIDKDSSIYIPVKANIDPLDIKTTLIAGTQTSAFPISVETTDCCKIPDNYKILVIKGADLIALFPSVYTKNFLIEFTTKGSTSVEFLPSGKYSVSVNTNHKNIKITRSDIGLVNAGTVAIFNIRKEPYNYLEYEGFWGDKEYVSAQVPLVELLTGIDDIRLVDRSTKYALFIIVLTFALIFFFDLRRKLASNAFQYLLVGISLAMFYLLTLAVGEYTGFTISYFTATIITALLNGWYTTSMLNSRKYGIFVGASLALLYVVFYSLLKLESASFLAGTLLLYLVLSVFMYASKSMNGVAQNTDLKTNSK